MSPTRSGPPEASQPPGPAVDAMGRSVVDPTKNVLDLVAAAIARQDDLRDMHAAHVESVAVLRAEHSHEARLIEAARIDAIRAVDAQQVQRAAEVAATQATTLATQVAVSAETLRTQVAAAASAATIALAAALEPVQKDIADLRRAQYEQQGKAAQTIETRVDNRASTGTIIAIVGTAVAVLGVIIVIVNIAIGYTP